MTSPAMLGNRTTDGSCCMSLPGFPNSLLAAKNNFCTRGYPEQFAACIFHWPNLRLVASSKTGHSELANLATATFYSDQY